MDYVDFHGYKVYKDGTIIGKTGKPLKMQIKRGYLVFHDSTRKNRKYYSAHRIVAQCFIPNPDNKPQVNHINGIKTDNRVENLEWVTASENTKHAHSTGLAQVRKGEAVITSKLTTEDIQYIRSNYERYNKDKNMTALAKQFGVSRSQIHKIIHYMEWKELS